MFRDNVIRDFRNEAEFVLNPPKELGSIAFLGYTKDNNLNVLICNQNPNEQFYVKVDNGEIISNFVMDKEMEELSKMWIKTNKINLVRLAAIMRNGQEGYDELALKINEYAS